MKINQSVLRYQGAQKIFLTPIRPVFALTFDLNSEAATTDFQIFGRGWNR